jgi:hypothetical protein
MVSTSLKPMAAAFPHSKSCALEVFSPQKGRIEFFSIYCHEIITPHEIFHMTSLHNWISLPQIRFSITHESNFLFNPTPLNTALAPTIRKSKHNTSRNTTMLITGEDDEAYRMSLIIRGWSFALSGGKFIISSPYLRRATWWTPQWSRVDDIISWPNELTLLMKEPIIIPVNF